MTLASNNSFIYVSSTTTIQGLELKGGRDDAETRSLWRYKVVTVLSVPALHRVGGCRGAIWMAKRGTVVGSAVQDGGLGQLFCAERLWWLSLGSGWSNG
jgi:hypothetical protein